MQTQDQSTEMTSGRRRSLTALVMALVVIGLTIAIILPTRGGLEPAADFLRRWFFAVFCGLYALVQVRVYAIRRRRQAKLARHVPLWPFSLFTVLWFVLAIAAIVYGFADVGERWAPTGWIAIGLLISVQLFVIGSIEQRHRS